jgi:hypothetical protein
MIACRIRAAVVGATLLSLSSLSSLPALAGGVGGDASAFALPSAPLALEVVPVFVPAAPRGIAPHAIMVPAVEAAPVRYRYGHHESAPSRGGGPASALQLHMGFFDPEGEPARSFLVGLRGGPMIDPHVQIGGGVDWAHEGDHVSQIATRTTGPGGTPITVQRDIARSSTDLVPVMGFLQLSAGPGMGIVPYFGAGAGYQVLNLSAEDYQTGQSFNATYGGWGWQMWGGAALPLSGSTRLKAELFANGAELGRDVADAVYGDSYRETVKVDGVGMRFGLAWGF